MDTNTVTLCGRLTRDPEMREAGDTPLATFSVAVNGFKKDESHFFDVKAWGKTAEFVEQHIGKGQRVIVTGELNQDRWESKEGEKRSKVVVNTRNLQVIDWKEDAAESAGATSGAAVDDMDAIPF